MKTRVIVAGLVRKDDQYLFIRQNKAGGAYPGTLHIPGGGLEPGETPDDAMRREFMEETGITVDSLERINFDWDILPYKGETMLLIFLQYTAVYAQGTPQPGSDAREIIWLRREEIVRDNHNPPSVRFLQKLGLIDQKEINNG